MSSEVANWITAGATSAAAIGSGVLITLALLDRRIVFGATAGETLQWEPGWIACPVDVNVSNPGRRAVIVHDLRLVAPQGGKLGGGLMQKRVRGRLSDTGAVTVIAPRGKWISDVFAAVPAGAVWTEMKLQFAYSVSGSGRRRTRTITLWPREGINAGIG